MSEKLCALRKIGGGTELKETVLWTNPNPSSSMNDTALTLSQSMDNFDYLQFDYRITTGDPNPMSIMISVEDFKLCKYAYKNNFLGFAAYSEQGKAFCRPIEYQSLTSVYVRAAKLLSSPESNGSMCVPTQIIGLK